MCHRSLRFNSASYKKLILATLLIFISVLLLSCGAFRQFTETLVVSEKTKVDESAKREAVAAKLSSHVPTPIWEQVTLLPEIDTTEPLDSQNILLGFTDLVWGIQFYSLFPKYGDLKAVNLKTGGVLWSLMRDNDYSQGCSLIATDPVPILRNGISKSNKTYQLLGIDKVSGHTRWQIVLQESDEYAFDTQSKSVIVISEKEKNNIVSYNAIDGTIRWSVQLPNENSSSWRFFLTEKNIILSSRSLYALSKKTGTLQWQLPVDNEITSASAYKDGLLIGTWNSIKKISSEGKVKWETPIDGTPMLMIADKDILAVEYISDEGVSHISSMNLKNSNMYWKYSVDGGVHSAIRIYNNKIYYSDSYKLIVRDAFKGDKCSITTIPGNPDEDRLADHLMLIGNEIVLCTETSLLAINHSGEQTWQIEIPESIIEKYLSAYNKYDVLAFNQDKSQKKEILPISTAILIDQRANIRFQIQFQDPINYLVDNTNLMDRSTGLAVKATATFLKALYDYSKTNPWDFQRNVNLTNATNAAQSLMATAMIQNARDADTARASAHADIVKNEHIRALVNERYWVRPFFWKYGRAVLLVDIKEHLWTELPIELIEEGFKTTDFLHSMALLINEDNSILFIKGMSLDSAKWKVDERVISKKTIQRSIMAFNMHSLKWKPVNDFSKTSWVNKQK